MNKIKIGVQVTAKVCPTKVTVSGTFQGYELQDKEDPTSVCGKVFYVKDGMQLLDYVYVDSIKVCKGEDEDERIRKALIDGIRQIRCKNGVTQEQMLAWLEKQKPVKCCKDTLLEWAKLVLKYQEEELAKYDVPSYRKTFTMGRIDAYKVLIAKLNSL